MFVRDPLARFTSAYLHKCFDANCSNAFCFPRFYQKPRGQDQFVPKGQPISFRHALDWIMRSNVATIDGNFKLQSNRCGIDTGGLENYFTVIGKMTKETLSSDADCIIEYANKSQYNIPTKSHKSIPRVGNTTTPPLTFWSPQGGLNVKYRQENENEILKKLFTKEAAFELMEKFRRDYDVFQLPVPECLQLESGWIHWITICANRSR